MNILNESYPKNPDTIILKNKFYPRGLTELSVYNHYMKYKTKILDWIDASYTAFFMKLEHGPLIVLRRAEGGGFIKLTPKNYDTVITGRTLVTLKMHPQNTNYFVIDIDAGKNVDRKRTIAAAQFVHGVLQKQFKTTTFEILTSSERGLHVIGYFNGTINIDKLRNKIEDILADAIVDKPNYLVNIKGRAQNTINFDLSPNYKNALHIARYSLTKDGLMCDDYKRGLVTIK